MGVAQLRPVALLQCGAVHASRINFGYRIGLVMCDVDWCVCVDGSTVDRLFEIAVLLFLGVWGFVLCECMLCGSQ